MKNAGMRPRLILRRRPWRASLCPIRDRERVRVGD